MSIVIPEHSERKYEPYPEYKDSGAEWLGKIPAYWDLKRLRFLAKINPSKAEIGDLSPSLEVTFLPMEDIGFGDLNIKQTRELGSVSEGYTYFRNGDVLVAKITPCFENGKGAISEGLLNGIGFGTTELHILRPTPDLNRRFLLYITISHAFRDIGKSQMYGAAGQKRVSESYIRDFLCSYPSLREQQAIADFLDQETARIDELIAKEQRLIDLLQEQRTALITRTVTKGLNPEVPMKDSGVEWLGKIPAHWEMTRLKYAFVLQRGFDLASEDFINGSYPVCGSNGIFGHHVAFTTKGPSVTVGRSGSVGEVNYYENDFWAHNTALYVREFLKSYPRFVYFLLKVLNLKSLSEGTAVGTLNRNYIHRLLLALPLIQEQKAIADYLDQETARIDRLVGRINQAIEKLQEYRTALITAAVSGKIDVRGRAS